MDETIRRRHTRYELAPETLRLSNLPLWRLLRWCGLRWANGHAVVTVSKPRNGTFAGLALDGELKARDAEAWCGVLVVSLATGDIVEYVRLEGAISELFDIVAMPGVTCPMAIGPDTVELSTTITFPPLGG